MLDIPYQVQNAPYIQNHVAVAPSNNWDLSRTITATPVIQIELPEPPVAIKPDFKLEQRDLWQPLLKKVVPKKVVQSNIPSARQKGCEEPCNPK